MWIFVAILLVSFGDAFCTRCTKPEYEACEVEENDYFGLPRNKEDLDTACRFTNDLAKCYLHYYEECGSEDEEYQKRNINFLRNVIDLLEEYCDPQSQVYKLATDKIECLRTSLINGHADETCRQTTVGEERLNMSKTYVDMLKQNMDDENLEECIESMWMIACKAVIVSDQCGHELLNPGIKTITAFDYGLHLRCKEELIEEIPAFAHALALIGEQAESVENEIRKKK